MYIHLFLHHFEVIQSKGHGDLLNKQFMRFYAFVWNYDLITIADIKPLEGLVSNLFKDDEVYQNKLRQKGGESTDMKLLVEFEGTKKRCDTALISLDGFKKSLLDKFDLKDSLDDFTFEYFDEDFQDFAQLDDLKYLSASKDNKGRVLIKRKEKKMVKGSPGQTLPKNFGRRMNKVLGIEQMSKEEVNALAKESPKSNIEWRPKIAVKETTHAKEPIPRSRVPVSPRQQKIQVEKKEEEEVASSKDWWANMRKELKQTDSGELRRSRSFSSLRKSKDVN